MPTSFGNEQTLSHNSAQLPHTKNDGSLLDESSWASKARIEALTDGIFATVMTVLVLGLRTLSPGLLEPDLKMQIFGLCENIVAYAFSFVVLGLFWIGHHDQFHYIK